MRVIIWGAGKYLPYVYEGMNDDVEVVAIIDSNEVKQGKTIYGIEIMSPQILKRIPFDAIVLSPLKTDPIEEYLFSNGYDTKRIIRFWQTMGDNDILRSRNELLLHTIKQQEIYRARLESAPYEWGLKDTPNILPAMDLLERILEERCSLSRYGDGEFNIMLKKGNPWFQEYDEKLYIRLREVLYSNDEKLLIAVAQNFRSLEQYTEEAADEIRMYMQENRNDILNVLPNRVYYDAYVSRPYLIYRNKKYAKLIFERLRMIWKNRNVLIVEGYHGRLGVGNDLFDDAKKIKRIICPDVNAWNAYDKILSLITKQVAGDDVLVCLSLGPVATVMAYDLCKIGIQSIDIGQIDNEYEWYKRGDIFRTQIKGKMVAELPRVMISDDFDDKEYFSQIIAKID